MNEATPVYVAAGSNVDALANLRRALDMLQRHFAPLTVSAAYANAAVGFEGDDFVNLVLRFDTRLDVHAVIDRLHEAEAACGRGRDAPKWAPRAMDLDILLFGELQCDEPGLKLPRPDLLKRPYMLGPAAEIAPQLVHPTAHRTLASLWHDMQESQAAHTMRPVELGWSPGASAC